MKMRGGTPAQASAPLIMRLSCILTAPEPQKTLILDT